MEDTQENSLRDILEREWTFHEAIHSKPYDGLNGDLPDDFSQDSKARFKDIRSILLTTNINGSLITPEQILEWISYREELRQPFDVDSFGFIPLEVEFYIIELENLKYLASLGKKERLRFLAGEKAANVLTNEGGKQKLGYETGHIKALRDICEGLDTYEESIIIKAIVQSVKNDQKPGTSEAQKGIIKHPYKKNIDPVDINIVFFEEYDPQKGVKINWKGKDGREEEGKRGKPILYSSLKRSIRRIKQSKE